MFTREQHIMRRRFSQNKNVPLLHLLCMASIYQCKTSIGSKYFLAYGQLNRRCEMPQIDQINHNLLCRPLTQIKVYSFHSFFIVIAIYQQKPCFSMSIGYIFFLISLQEKLAFLCLFLSILIRNKRTISVNIFGLTRLIKYLFMEDGCLRNK